MKQFFLTTGVGRVLLAGRDNLYLMRAALQSSEELGTIANDQLATTLVPRLARPGTIFVDVGAHLGSVSAEARRNEPSIRIIAIEAMPDKVANLRRRFPTIEVVECAVGEREGELSFFVNTRESGYSSLERPEKADNQNIREIRVSVKPLDTLVPADGVDVVKIDVEGAELGVLRGAAKLLATSRPVIMFESAPKKSEGAGSDGVGSDSLGYTNEAMWQLLHDAEYNVLIPNRLAHDDPGLSMESFCESHLYPRRTTNYFAVAKERRTEIRDRARQAMGSTAKFA